MRYLTLVLSVLVSVGFLSGCAMNQPTREEMLGAYRDHVTAMANQGKITHFEAEQLILQKQHHWLEQDTLQYQKRKANAEAWNNVFQPVESQALDCTSMTAGSITTTSCQ